MCAPINENIIYDDLEFVENEFIDDEMPELIDDDEFPEIDYEPITNVLTYIELYNYTQEIVNDIPEIDDVNQIYESFLTN